jgi:multidrug/hemolysin transport system permease protein
MSGLIERNLKVFFRDKASVFFSLLAVLLIFALYLLFLGDVWLDSLPQVDGAKALMDSWIMSGVLAVTSMTTVMGAFGTMVDDKSKKILKDFDASPLSRGKVVAGYGLASFLVGSIMSLIAFVLAEIYIVSRGGALLGFGPAVEVIGLVLLSALCNTAFIALIVSFISSQSAFGTASSIVGTLVGFLTGIYLPVGMLPSGVQLAVKCFPLSHAALLIRRVMMADSLNTVFAAVPASVGEEFEEQMGVFFRFGGQTLPVWASAAILVGSAVVFFLIATWRFSRKAK